VATPLQKAACVLRHSKTRCAERMQGPYRTEFGMDAPSKPAMYAFYKQFYESDCLSKGVVPFAVGVRLKLEYQLYLYKVTSSARFEYP
jgi:hypothetical protein